MGKGFFMSLPLLVDLKRDGTIVERAKAGQRGYAENIECSLQISATKDGLRLSYYCEDGNELDMDQFHDVIKLANV